MQANRTLYRELVIRRTWSAAKRRWDGPERLGRLLEPVLGTGLDRRLSRDGWQHLLVRVAHLPLVRASIERVAYPGIQTGSSAGTD